MIVDGFDLESPLVCEGIIGDGCGGGRIFFIREEKLYAYDPVSRESLVLLAGIGSAIKLSKSACIITIETYKGTIEFDLQTLS